MKKQENIYTVIDTEEKKQVFARRDWGREKRKVGEGG